MVAAYGLRPQEIERCTQIDQNLIKVLTDTKTGYRTVIQVHEDRVELFRLHERGNRRTSSREKSPLDVISQWLNNMHLAMGIEWRTYSISIRHAYAARVKRH